MAYVKASTQYKREHKADYGHEKIEILYQDEWLVVINKPSGLMSVPYPGSKSRTAMSVLEEILRKQGKINSKHKPYIVHRLDRDTSGVMMFALTENACNVIMNSWHTMVTERLYHAVSELRNEKSKNENLLAPLSDSGWIEDELAQNAHNVGYVPKKGAKDKNGHQIKTVKARTFYKKILEGPTHCLFELSLDTGKKNQIRAHLAAHGYPLCGDEEHRAHTDPFHRLCLHARTLEFDHPFTHEHLKFEVAEPEEWAMYVKKGDKHPQVPVWEKEFKSKNSSTHSHKSNSEILKENLGEKRLSRKDRVHMGYIQSGKKK